MPRTLDSQLIFWNNELAQELESIDSLANCDSDDQERLRQNAFDHYSGKKRALLDSFRAEYELIDLTARAVEGRSKENPLLEAFNSALGKYQGWRLLLPVSPSKEHYQQMKEFSELVDIGGLGGYHIPGLTWFSEKIMNLAVPVLLFGSMGLLFEAISADAANVASTLKQAGGFIVAVGGGGGGIVGYYGTEFKRNDIRRARDGIAYIHKEIQKAYGT